MHAESVPVVSVVIIHFHSGEQIFDAIRSAQQQQAPLEIIVVDNDSQDAESLRLERMGASGEIRYLPQQKNLGFSDANNLAIAEARGEFVLTLNADVCLDENYLASLIAAMREDPLAGAASGKLRLAADHDRIDSAGILLFRDGAAQDRGQGQLSSGRFEQRESVLGACAAAALYRRSMLNELGAGGEYFRSAFFAFLEDVDLAARATMLGWNCVYVPDATAAHVRGGTTRDPPFIRYLKMRNEMVLAQFLVEWGAGHSRAAFVLLFLWRLATGSPVTLLRAWRDARVLRNSLDPFAGLPPDAFDPTRLEQFLQPSYLLERLDSKFR